MAAQCICKFLMGPVALSEAVTLYQYEYSRQFAPLLSAASRVRSLLSLPPFVQSVIFELFRLPGLLPYVIRKTRRAV